MSEVIRINQKDFMKAHSKALAGVLLLSLAIGNVYAKPLSSKFRRTSLSSNQTDTVTPVLPRIKTTFSHCNRKSKFSTSCGISLRCSRRL